MSKDLVVYTVSDMEKMAKHVADSKLFGIKTPQEAMALMLVAQAEGNHPAIAVRDYHIIQGKPALKADAMLARFQLNGGKVRWLKLSNEECSAVFSHASGGDATITWSLEDAKRAGFAGKDNWKKFPRQMLRSRVISEGIRTVFPGVVVGSYTPEEVQDYDGTTIDVPSSDISDLSGGLDDEIKSRTGGLTQEEKKALYKEAEEALEVVSDLDELKSWHDQYHPKLSKAIAKIHMDKLNNKYNALQSTLENKQLEGKING
jgi:hypothetical protein